MRSWVDGVVHRVRQPRGLHRRGPAAGPGAGVDLPDRVRGAALFADISGFTPLTEALVTELGAAARRRGAEQHPGPAVRRAARPPAPPRRQRGLLQRRRGDLLAGRRRRDAGHQLRPGDAGGDGRPRGWSTLPSGRTVQLAMKVAVAVGPRPPVRGRRPADPADRRAGRGPDGPAGRDRAPGRRRRGACWTSRPWPAWATGSSGSTATTASGAYLVVARLAERR